jgi:hypothetical protein
MPESISSVAYRDISWPDQPSDREDFRETVVNGADRDNLSSVCREPPTVLGATIWGDETDVANACRCAEPGGLDDLFCDDALLRKAQEEAAYIAQKAAELVLGARMGRWK